MVFKDRRKKYVYLMHEDELRLRVEKHKTTGSISTDPSVTQDIVQMNFSRAVNELKTARALFKISTETDLRRAVEAEPEDTFYSSAISHAYYSIFFATKALLLTEKIKTSSPNVHVATLDAFAYEFVISGKLDVKLLELYRSSLIKADSLLGLLIEEKNKRGRFTYKILPQANEEPAEQSIKHAVEFLKHIKQLINKR